MHEDRSFLWPIIGGLVVTILFCSVMLDSDDLYSSPQTLQSIVKAFYEQHAAMVVGSYRICDFKLNTLPPGLISHDEWTDDNTSRFVHEADVRKFITLIGKDSNDKTQPYANAYLQPSLNHTLWYVPEDCVP